MSTTHLGLRIAVPAICAMLTLAISAPVQAATRDEERRGAAIASQIESGKLRCKNLTDAQSETVGELAMGLQFESAKQHAAMDARMREMMGNQAARAAHRSMGRSYAGCARGRGGTSAWMPGTAGMMDGRDGSINGTSSGMMGGQNWPDQQTGDRRADDLDDRFYGNHMGGDWGNGWMIIGTILAVAFTAILGAILAMTMMQRRSDSVPGRNDNR